MHLIMQKSKTTNKQPPYFDWRETYGVLEPRGWFAKQTGKATIRLRSTDKQQAIIEAWDIISNARNADKEAVLFANAFMQWCEQDNTAISTQATRQSHSKFWLKKDHFETATLHEITASGIRKILKDSDHAPNYKATLLGTLRTFFAELIDESIMETNPASAVRIKKPPPTPKPQDAKAILELIQHAEREGFYGIADAVFFGLHTGLRRIDIINLTKDHIDGATITLIQQKTSHKHTIPIMKPVRERLATIATRNPTQHIITDQQHRRYSTHLFNKHWDKVRRTAGMADINFKDLRDTFATNISKAGATKEQIQAALGHTPNSQSWKSYAKLQTPEFAEHLPQE